MKIIALIVVSLVMLVSPLAAEIPHQINYQGLLTDDSGTPLAGTYDLTFTIYPDTLTGTLIWTETQYGIEIEDGLVNLLLGRKTPLLESHFDQDERWLEIAVDGSTLSPRMKMTSVPWALRASIADTALVTLGGSGDGHSLDADDGTPEDVVYVEGDGGVRIGIPGTGYDVNFYSNEVGGKMFWDQHKMAFRAGYDDNNTHWNDANVGLYSFASGYSTIASGNFSTALGASAIASGDLCFATGVSSVASGWSSTAIGNSSTATGSHSLALSGFLAEAIGTYSVAIGSNVNAVADACIIIGAGIDGSHQLSNNTANSLVVGFNTTDATLFVGGPEHRIGIGTTAPTEKLEVNGLVYSTSGGFRFPDGTVQTTAAAGAPGSSHSLDADDGSPVDVVYVEGSGDVSVGSDGTGYDVNFYGATAGGRTFWDQSKMAFRTGIDTDGTHWNDPNIGMYSFASGSNNIASAQFTTAIGQGSSAIGPYSTAIGTYCEANGLRSVAIGYSADAIGDLSHAYGTVAEAGGTYAVAIGNYVTAAADTSFVIGSGINSSNELANNTSNSLIVGFNTTESTLFVGGPGERVGVGTDTPVAKLDVDGSMHVRDSLLVGSSSQDGELKIFRNGTSVPVVYGFPSEEGGNLEIWDEEGNLAVDIHADYSDVGGHIEMSKEAGPFAAKGVDIIANYAGSGQPAFRLWGPSPDRDVFIRTDLTGSSCVQLPQASISSPEIDDEAGAASAVEGSNSITLDGTVQTMLSRSITVPGAGLVMVIGTVQPNITHTYGTNSMANFGVSDVSTSFPTNQDVGLTISASAPSGSYNIPVTVHGLFEVTSGGTVTYYLLADEIGGDFSVFDMQLTLVYLPTAYGTVEATATASLNVPDDRASQISALSSGDLAAERRDSEAANIARLERELEAIRAELDAMKGDDDGRMHK